MESAEVTENPLPIAIEDHKRKLEFGDSGVVSSGNILSIGSFKFHPTKAEIKFGDQTYKWNSRSHRKLRLPEALSDKTRHPSKLKYRIHFFSWQPKIITWWNVWSGLVGITLWVINGYFLVWPEQTPKGINNALFLYRLGACGAFIFIIGGYLEFVEAINQTHAEIRLPNSKEEEDEKGHKKIKEPRKFKGTRPNYGQRVNPVAKVYSEAMSTIILKKGYALVEDVETKELVSPDVLDRTRDKYGSKELEQGLVGRALLIRLGSHVLKVNVTGVVDEEEFSTRIKTEASKDLNVELVRDHHRTHRDVEGYVWWSWDPDLHHIGIFNAVVYFISTIIFFLPALIYLPFEEHGFTAMSTFIWVYIPQIIASCGFIYSGYAGMAEASGSWCAADCQSIGWWISFLNTVGGYGFLLFPLCAMPELFGPTNCCYVYTQWGANFASFWGSCSFFIASFLSCIEFASEHPITLTLNY